MFSQVENKNVEVPSLAIPVGYDERNLSRLVRFAPIKDKDTLSFVWHLPSSEHEY